MNSVLTLNGKPLPLEVVKDYVFERKAYARIELGPEVRAKALQSRKHLLELLEKKIPVYGVTTGFGDSSGRFIDANQSESLQANLAAYLNCGTGKNLPELACRATQFFRLVSLSKGFSGVSVELLERMALFLDLKLTPVTPSEGSLGASGDLIPLSYLANVLKGTGEVYTNSGPTEVAEILVAHKIEPYSFKSKEALAIVNGTSTMAGLALTNLNSAHFLFELSILTTSWMCIALKGRVDPFNALVNEKAKNFSGQKYVAENVRKLLAAESYDPEVLAGGPVQDRYSLRCAPQILGPVLETIEQGWSWLETEINSASDNPLIDEDGTLSTGGNFYGGYLTHSMDYLKISLANQADMLDRQLILLMDERQNRGLPPNLAAWDCLPEHERFLHHGLKGLHQSVSAITSEIMAKATPNSIFSRSSENHNQDKVSLGLSAAVQCEALIDQLYNLQAMVLICAAQGLELRKVKLKGETSVKIMNIIRAHVPFVERDQALARPIAELVNTLKRFAISEGQKILSS